MSDQGQPPVRTNRLARENSPYLRQHAGNPVDWYPWGEEALALARGNKKPILLSVGYSACHWCHVMAHESFEDPETARLMNDHFVNIKVDREERPDLDQLYQGVVVLTGRGGGWPLTVFLTPELRPFFGGTYFPPEDRHGVPGFRKLLNALHEAWVTQPEDIQSQAQQFELGLAHLATYGLEAPPSALTVRDVVSAAQRLEREVDRAHGGFGGAPKFPNPMSVAVLLRGYRRSGIASLRSAALLTLGQMAVGGIYDQLGGGFHRYSVDERWQVPHFEKMLYDNAQLLHLYAEAFQVEPRPLWKRVVEQTAEYVRREMTAPSGGFYAAQDADSEGEEGKFFVWTPAEIDAALAPEHAAWVKEHYGVTEAGNFEQGRSVLEVAKDEEDLAEAVSKSAETVSSALAAARQRLFEFREKRVKPGRDDKILAGWNGLMVRGLAFASRVFGRSDWAALAQGAADFVLSAMWQDGRLLRSHQNGVGKIDAFIEDYGDLAAGLVALFQANGDAKYLEAADALATAAVGLFWDENRQAYLSAPKGQKDLLCPPYALHDNAYPSGASSLTEAQVALAALTGKRAHLDQAEKYLQRMRDEMTRNPFAYGHLLLSADSYLEGAGEITLVGERHQLEPLLAVLNATYAPTLAVLIRLSGADVPPILKDALRGREQVKDGVAAAYLCRNFACEAPLTEPEELKLRLTRLAAVPITSF